MPATKRVALLFDHEVALTGVDNDELECHLCHPPLTSIAVPGRRIGFEAARVLDETMQGRKPQPVHRFIAPVRVVAPAAISSTFAKLRMSQNG